MTQPPNILFIMTDQQRFDTIAALGNSKIYTPNMDRLVRRGLSFDNAYSTCPVCVPARYIIRTGCESPKVRMFNNGNAPPVHGQADSIEGRCGPYLAKVMHEIGYRTIGVGKFHSRPWNEDLGYEVHLQCHEIHGSAKQREYDDYANWLKENYPEYDHLEGLMGERAEMYYMPQVSIQPAHCAVEAWTADQAVAQLTQPDKRPYFSMVSFIGPHPPFAPPIPFNRMYNPDLMSDPIGGNIETDHMDQQIPRMNHLVWAQSINNAHARTLKARYYGEISYIDHCLGKILDAVEARPDHENTLICFFSDHGDHLGDHHAWQKESFFEASTRIPFLLSWPAKLSQNEIRQELISLADLFGIATTAAGQSQLRDGSNLLDTLLNDAPARQALFGFHGIPGTSNFKIMVRHENWKYIFMANGGKEQLFDLDADSNEFTNLADSRSDISAQLKAKAIAACQQPGAVDALEDSDLKEFPYTTWEWKGERHIQFDLSKGIKGYPDHPGDALNELELDQSDPAQITTQAEEQTPEDIVVKHNSGTLHKIYKRVRTMVSGKH